MQIDWSLVLFEVLNFGLLVWLMTRFLYRPVRKALEARRDEIEAGRREATEREAQANALRSTYEVRLAELQDEVTAKLAQAAEDAHTLRAAAIDEGREAARHLLDEARAEIGEGRRQALRELRTEVFAIASAAATRIVGEVVDVDLTRAFARRGAHALRDALGVRTLGGPVELWIPSEADPDELTAEIVAVLGPTTRLQRRTDPGLVAGVRLVAEGHEVEASVSDSLAAWYEQRVATPDASGAARGGP